MAMYSTYKDLPVCCKICIHRGKDFLGDYQPFYCYCSLNIILPTVKNECGKFIEIKKGDSK